MQVFRGHRDLYGQYKRPQNRFRNFTGPFRNHIRPDTCGMGAHDLVFCARPPKMQGETKLVESSGHHTPRRLALVGVGARTWVCVFRCPLDPLDSIQCPMRSKSKTNHLRVLSNLGEPSTPQTRVTVLHTLWVGVIWMVLKGTRITTALAPIPKMGLLVQHTNLGLVGVLMQDTGGLALEAPHRVLPVVISGIHNGNGVASRAIASKTGRRGLFRRGLLFLLKRLHISRFLTGKVHETTQAPVLAFPYRYPVLPWIGAPEPVALPAHGKGPVNTTSKRTCTHVLVCFCFAPAQT